LGGGQGRQCISPARAALGWAALVVGLGIAGAPGCRRKPELTPQQAEGQHLYAVRCAHCHEENDLGLKPPPPNLRGVMQRGKFPSGAAATNDAVQRVVLMGKGKMPGFAGRFSEDQMQALIAYLRTSMPLPHE
jgi:mono/diheme cytochrome c family protein